MRASNFNKFKQCNHYNQTKMEEKELRMSPGHHLSEWTVKEWVGACSGGRVSKQDHSEPNRKYDVMVHSEWHKGCLPPELSVAWIGKWTMSSFRHYVRLPKSCPHGMWNMPTYLSSFHSQWLDNFKDVASVAWLMLSSISNSKHWVELVQPALTYCHSSTFSSPSVCRIQKWWSCNVVSCVMILGSTRCGRLDCCRTAVS